MKVAIYCRVSTDDQHIDQQREMLVDWCNRYEHTYRTYKDENQSGKISDRPEWQRLLSDVNKEGFNAILVTKWDRITRDPKYGREFLDWLKPLHDTGFRLLSIFDGDFDFSPDKVFQFHLKCLLSEYELTVLKWRSRIGIERAKKEGKYKYGNGRPKPSV